MTAITDAKTVINILTKGNASNDQMLRIANAFRVYAGSEFIAEDLEKPKPEELAQNFLAMIRRFGLSVLEAMADRETEIANAAAKQQKREAARADL